MNARLLCPVLVAVLSFGWPAAAGAQHEGHAPAKPQDPAAGARELPPITDEDRGAAFPDVQGHTVHDQAVHSFLLFDRLEWQGGNGENGMSVDSRGWVGRDLDRVWFRAEGEGAGGDVSDAQVHLLYGRKFSRWWDVVAGVRQDFRPGAAQTWAAIGVQGLAPYWFEVEATAYVGASGRTQARVEVEYELLLTNRLVLQPVIEMEVFGKSDPERGLGAGLATTDAGIRVRYEIRRELAPYVGVSWARKYGGTADLAEAAGEETAATQLVAGLRLWF